MSFNDILFWVSGRETGNVSVRSSSLAKCELIFIVCEMLNAISQRVTDRMHAFYDRTFLDPGVTPEQILQFFVTGADSVVLPFPSSLQFSRIKFVEGTSDFVYFRRESFNDLHRLITAEGKGVRVFGLTGSGKSHVLAAYAVYLHCLRLREPDGVSPRVVYLSSCGEAGVCIHAELVKALHLAYPTHDAFNGVTLQRPPAYYETLVQNVLGHESMVFIYDDFNYILGLETETRSNVSLQERTKVGAWLLACAQGSKRVESISANGLNTSLNSEVLSILKFPAGLSATEWPAWRDSPILSLFNSCFNDPELTQRVMYFTGLSPIYLTQLNSYRAMGIDAPRLDFDAALERFDRDHGEGGVSNRICGRRIVAALTAYALSVPAEMHSRFVEQMRDVCMGVSSSSVDMKLYDPRFFYLDSDNYTLHPVNGYIAQQQLRILLELERYRESLALQTDLKWAREACKNENPVIRGFAYEFYYICDIIRQHRPTPTRIVRFYGNFPNQRQLQTATTELVLYWPIKWNLHLHRIGFVSRQLVIEDIPETSLLGRFQETFKKRKVTATSVEICAYQVTCMRPLEHPHSLTFYSTPRPPAGDDGFDLPDCRRYELFSDPAQRVHKLIWVVPDSLVDKRVPSTTLVFGSDTVVQQKVIAVVCS